MDDVRLEYGREVVLDVARLGAMGVPARGAWIYQRCARNSGRWGASFVFSATAAEWHATRGGLQRPPKDLPPHLVPLPLR
jgi:hypothetical protein